jgi:hypothetical protein
MPYHIRLDFSVAGTPFRYWLALGGTWSQQRSRAHAINTRARAVIVRRRMVSLARRGNAQEGWTLPDKKRDKRLDRYTIVREDGAC